MLQTEGLQFSYNGSEQLSFPDIRCEKGEQWLILGQSGSGKTTLLHLLGGLRTPQQGKVIIDGVNLGGLSPAQLDHFRGQRIGIVFQQSYFIRAVSVADNLRLAQQLADKPADDQRIRALLERLRIDHKLSKRPDELSQGEQQRLAIARALLNKPAVILADEPTSALDDLNCEEVIRLLADQAREEQATLLVVTHDGRLKERFEKKLVIT